MEKMFVYIHSLSLVDKFIPDLNSCNTIEINGTVWGMWESNRAEFDLGFYGHKHTMNIISVFKIKPVSLQWTNHSCITCSATRSAMN